MPAPVALQINTTKRCDMINIAHDVQKIVSESGVQEGLCTVFVPHTTAGVTINENADPDVVTDMLGKLSRLVPEHDNYNHAEGNSDSHVKTSMMGPSLNIIITEGRLCLGVWQGIYFCEFDGARQRRCLIKVIEG